MHDSWSCIEERKQNLGMGQVGEVRRSERSKVTPRLLDDILCITACDDQVVGGDQREEVRLGEGREKRVAGGDRACATVGKGCACLGGSEKSSLTGVEGSSCRGEKVRGKAG